MTTHYIMSTDGSFMDICTCYVVSVEDLPSEELEELEAGTNDSTIATMAEEYGQWLPRLISSFDADHCYTAQAQQRYDDNDETAMAAFNYPSDSAAANESGSIS